MNIKKGDFVEIKYVGRLEDNTIFDLNDKEIAKKENIQAHIHDKTIVCLGSKDVVEGLDEFLIDKEIGKKLHINLPPEKAFGKKDAKLFQMIPMKKFLEQKINPMPGLTVEIDNYTGVIKSISGGRVMVDLNHPLAGKNVSYEITILRKVDDLKEKVEGFLEMNFHLHNPKIEVQEHNAILDLPIPKEMLPLIEAELKKRIPELKSLSVKEKK
jgi:FKBP-type peptidyl-prolyl cis-trans isomerase SlyD